MKYKFELLMTASVLFCLSLTTVAPADSCVKTLYIDGAYIDYADVNQALSWPYERITIGSEANRWQLYNEYTGKMDEFAIYAGVLDPARITAHHSARSVDYAAYVAAVQADSPLLYLQFEDASTDHNDVADNSGNIGIDGTYVSTGVGSITQTTGIAADSNAIVFPGAEPDANGNCVDVWDGNGDFSSNLDGDVTIELWVNFTDTNDFPRFFQHNGAWDVEGAYGVMVNGPNESGVIGGGTTNYMATPGDINDGDWHHIVVTYDSTYALPETGEYANEVMADNPVLYLRFEESGPKDRSGNNYWVAYGGGTHLEEKVGGIGSSIYLDGASGGMGSSCAIAAANQQTEPDYTGRDDQYAFAPNDITFEFWMKSLPPEEPQMSAYGLFFQQIKADEANAPGMGNSDGTIRILNGISWWYTGITTPLNQQWHHMVVTYDEEYEGDPNSMGIQFYLDGFLAGSRVVTDPNGEAVLGPELSHLVIGGENDRGYIYNTYAGYIDEFAIYEGALSAERVLIHYAAWQIDDCAEFWDRVGGIAADIDKDCDVDFRDFASLALDWLLCNDPGSSDPNCVPNW